MKKIILFIIVVCLSFGSISIVSAAKNTKDKEEINEVSCDKQITVHLFWGKGCPHCEAAISYFDSIKSKYGDCFKLEKYETWYDPSGKELLESVASYLGEDVGGVPYIVIGEKTFSGYSESLNSDIEKAIENNANDDDYVDVVEKVKAGEDAPKKSNRGDTIVTITILLVAIVGIVALVKTSQEK